MVTVVPAAGFGSIKCPCFYYILHSKRFISIGSPQAAIAIPRRSFYSISLGLFFSVRLFVLMLSTPLSSVHPCQLQRPDSSHCHNFRTSTVNTNSCSSPAQSTGYLPRGRWSQSMEPVHCSSLWVHKRLHTEIQSTLSPCPQC